MPANRTNAIARFILAQHAGMTDYLRVPLLILTLVFSESQRLFAGRALVEQPPERRRMTLRRWKTIGIGPVSDLIRFYESLTVVALYDEHFASFEHSQGTTTPSTTLV